jgi:hypothetical protein
MPTQEHRERFSPADRDALARYVYHDQSGTEYRNERVVLGVPVGGDKYISNTCVEVPKARHGRAIAIMCRADSSLPCQR